MNHLRLILKRMNLLLCIFLFLLLATPSDMATAKEVNTKNYTIDPYTKPIYLKYMKYSTYNNYTKHYYLLRSYLEQLEKTGGGTLTLDAGCYKISNTLYIPSNVTIHLNDGVIIKKIDETGIASLKSSKCILTMAAPSKSNTAGAYGEYNGVTNVKIVGSGNAIIDLNYDTDCLGITMGHNTNVTISGITFRNMKGGHFIELDASQNVLIENNNFSHHQTSGTGSKEAINLDTPDRNTGGFHAVWTDYDCTANKDVIIQNNTFYDLERAIGTHKYSEGKYHENVQILNNKITDIDSDAIRVLNWSNPVIKGNVIDNVASGKGNKRAILASGVSNPIITGNTFSNVSRPIQVMPWKNTDDSSDYAITYNELSEDNIASMLNNTIYNVQENFIRINNVYNDYFSNTDKYYF